MRNALIPIGPRMPALHQHVLKRCLCTALACMHGDDLVPFEIIHPETACIMQIQSRLNGHNRAPNRDATEE